MLAELNEVLGKIIHGPSHSPQRVLETSDTSGDEMDTSRGRGKILSKQLFKMKKVYGPSEIGRFFATGPRDAARKHSNF